jgi:outer membrane protein
MRIQEHAIFLAALAAPTVAFAGDLPGSKARQTQPAVEAPRSPWSAMIALGGGMMPEFPGSKHYKVMPFGMGRLAYRDYYIEVLGPRAKINLIPGGMFEAGALVGYDSGRDNSVKSRRLKLLPEVESSVEFGGFAKLNLERLLLQNDKLSFGVEFAKASEGHEGYTVNLQTSYGIQFSRSFFMSLDAEVQFADKKYSNAYFGVNAVGAAATGLPSYTASAGVTSAELGLTARYLFSPTWGLTGRVAYGRMLGDAAKSPIVKTEGDVNQFSGGLAVLYRF